MAEQRVYKCLCGSTDFETDSNGVSTCAYCGCKFVAQNGSTKFKILPKSEETEFVRNAWIHLACEDVPFEVFDCDFKEVGEVEFQVMVDSVRAKVPYQASIGYDREEAYLDTQTYTEKVPYTDTVSVYDSATKQQVERQVTRYKNVDRQRQVTRYRTVTDWRPFSSEHNAKSVVCLRNGDKMFSSKYSTVKDIAKDDDAFGLDFAGETSDFDVSAISFDGNLFQKNLECIENGFVVAPEKSECEEMQISPSARREARRIHDANIEVSLTSSMCGDHFKDLTFSVDISENSTQLFLVPEYYATIEFANEKQTITVLPFGEGSPSGGEIDNLVGIKAYRERKLDELNVEKKKICDRYSGEKWHKSKTLLTVANVLLALSILGLIAVGVVSLIYYIGDRWEGYPVAMFVLLIVFAAFFVAAVVMFIVSRVNVGRSEKELSEAERCVIDAKEESIKSDIDAFYAEHKAKQLELLNKKLKSLGLKQATAEEISKET